jgi:2-acylglycerol O-acyltransferase 2
MQYDYGFLPHRIPLITIIGEPIECPLINNPSDEEVNSFHQLYVSKLAELVAKHKGSDLLKVL